MISQLLFKNKISSLNQQGRKLTKLKQNTLIYFSKNGNLSINLNGQVDNKNGDKIICEDLALEFLKQHKIYHLKFSSEERLKKIPSLVESLVDERKLLYKADKYYLFSKEKFGYCLSKVCESMQQENKKTLNVYFGSTVHAMSIRVERKQYVITTGKVENYFILKFYDPNITTKHTRAICKNILDMVNLEITDFIENEFIEGYDFSSKESVGIFGVYDETYNFDKKLNNLQHCNIKGLTNKAKALHFLFKHNARDILIEIVNSVLKDKSLDNEQKMKLLLAHTELIDNTISSGLYMAIDKECIETIIDFMDTILASKLPLEAKLEIITAKAHISKTRSISGLYIALMSGYTQVVIKYIEKILAHPEFSKEIILKLLEAKDGNGIPGLYLALVNGHTKTSLLFIKHTIQFGIDIDTLNAWMTIDDPAVGNKLHGVLIAIAKNENFLQDLNGILSDSERKELYQTILNEHEPIIEKRYLVVEKLLNILGYTSNDEFCEAMGLSLKALKAEIEAP